MKSISKIFLSLLLVTLISACSWWWESSTKEEATPIPTPSTEPAKTSDNIKPAEIKAPEVSKTKIEDSKDQKESKEKEDALAKCLKEKSVKLYWTSWCSHCNRQKEMLWPKAVEIIWFVDCDKEKAACTEAQVRWYPTWTVNWEVFPWARELSFIAEKAWCKF